jgi:hypothetical protein
VTCHLDDAEKRSGKKATVEENQPSVTERESVLGQSGGAERRHHLVKFELKPVV